jgi:hypothetical protein
MSLKSKILEHITMSELKIIERFADSLFKTLNIDIVFTTHFYDRLNDFRNGKEIENEELIDVFKKFFLKYRNKISYLPLSKPGIIQDLNSKINIPFVLTYDEKNDEIDFIAKTIMRKDNFLGKEKRYIV